MLSTRLRQTEVSGGDPNFANVSLLLHMDGTNGSTSFVDSGPNALAVTTTADAKITTSDSKFGGAALALDGTGDMLNVASNALFAYPGNFTVEFWFKLNSIKTGPHGFINTPVSGGLSIYYSGSSGYFGGVNSFRVSNRISNLLEASYSLSTGTWYHLAVSRSGSNLRLFINGSQVGSTASTTYSFAQAALEIGGSTDGTGWSLDGIVDDYRSTKGVARYTSNFTVPSSAFPDS